MIHNHAIQLRRYDLWVNPACDICQILEKPAREMLTADHWIVTLQGNQSYFGRAYVTTRDHRESLSELNESEWSELHHVIKRLEKAYKDLFNANPINWGCYMNGAYNHTPAVPHVHWHLIPRYKVAPILDGVSYEDREYGQIFDDYARRPVNDDVINSIVNRVREYLN